MDNHNLIKMANNIGAFFKSEPDRELAIKGVEQHIRNFWEPRMRKAIVEYVQQGGKELMEIVSEAVLRIAK
ncbi:formate dehydrogenase subunit delta [Methylomonas sp. MO1]|uniref:Formate dehydrogenase subunit delta n=2 Tax=Methylococcaceae TaxID=403 RepID=A0ABR9DF65_9GAMM|nr:MULTISPECIES: formate dehydrogenase subunit delta [Methylomonas]PKD41644.1 formate dehydrogenase [Methylomonas sp. Kb3]QBC26461.1 formate dehydrogenase [Methylomonas sp. LW13]MBD9361728.1 formate dehydrogenase subunit delta [Methylomonas fluvii]MDT4288552.1 formate dehydrogenase subunit delta [Methylomonas sp. MO1]CAD6874727.1 NAD-dependent formate dehydrogenase delta subunit [Methylomonas fluvii]